MRRIAVLTAGGDTPALNATLYGVGERANQLGVEVFGIMKGFGGMIDPRVPHLHLNPLFTTIPELDPCLGGTILGASRTYISGEETDLLKAVAGRLMGLGIEGLICIGGDGTINGMQPLSEFFPCVLAPKTIDNDLGLNYLDEPNDWVRDDGGGKKHRYLKRESRDAIELDDIVNYATPGYATAVFVVALSVNRIRTTAESHRRIAIVEVMGRDSGYISLGSAYGQPDIVLIPEIPIDLNRLEQRVRELYELQKHCVITCGEGCCDETGRQLGAAKASVDPAGNVLFSGAAEELKRILMQRLGDSFFKDRRRHDTADQAIFTRKIGHTQRGGRPLLFDRFHAVQLGGKAVDLISQGRTNEVATLQYSAQRGFTLDSLPANKLRDRWGQIHPRHVHPSFYDETRFQPSRLGRQYLMPIFTNAIGSDDVEVLRTGLFATGNLWSPYRSVNVDVHKRLRFLAEEGRPRAAPGQE
jgi:6-phosphofructokinase 1